MPEYRKGYKVNPETGLTDAEQRAGLTREEAKQTAADAQAGAERGAGTSAPKRAARASSKKGGHKKAWIVGGSVGVLLLLIILAAALGGGDGSSDSASPGSPTTQAEPPPPPPAAGPKKATNGDDANDLHDRAQQAVNRAEVCLAAVQLASQDTSSPASMAGSLQKARDICEESKSYLVSEDFHGFSDQATALFASADAGKSATSAGIEYLDTQFPSKLADFTTHVQDSAGYFNQGFSDLNARLNELGVARVKR